MIRILSILVGLFFTVALVWSFGNGAYTAITEPAPATAEHEFHLHPKDVSFPSDGAFGKFDRAQLQRGFQVYKEVCAACHSLNYVAFRDLSALGYSEAEVKAIAKGFQVPGIDPNTGEATMRPGMATDYFPAPFANDVAARAANNNALPPDLSLITKARHDGANYVASLLNGYQNQPAELLRKFPDAKTPQGLHYNPYFANLNIAMPPPITADGQVTYEDGTPATREQMSKDVSAFLAWTAEPNLESRHAAGFAAVIFLAIFVFLTWGAYQNVWRGVKH